MGSRRAWVKADSDSEDNSLKALPKKKLARRVQVVRVTTYIDTGIFKFFWGNRTIEEEYKIEQFCLVYVFTWVTPERLSLNKLVVVR